MIAILGPKEKVTNFKLIGIDPFPCEPDEAPRVLEKILNNYQIILYTQEIHSALKPIIERVQKRALPCIALLPTLDEKITEARIKNLIKKATGTDLLAK
ncbi:MAG: V-type ATP synthase subunit F [candidate division WOR-3 bacterium]